MGGPTRRAGDEAVSLFARPTTKRSRWARFVDGHLPRIVIYLLVVTLVAVVLFPYVVVTVPSGYVGVLWKRFGNGTVLDPRQLRGEGLRFLCLGTNCFCTI